MRPDTDEPDEEGTPEDAEADRRVLGWGGPANPNTADGEIQGISAFAASAVNATGWRRTVAKAFAWGAIILIVAYVLVTLGLATKLL